MAQPMQQQSARITRKELKKLIKQQQDKRHNQE
jgi:hypothetical protein